MNAAGVCHCCHTRIHNNTGWAYRHGLLVKGYLEPHEVAVFSGCGLDCKQQHVVQ